MFRSVFFAICILSCTTGQSQVTLDHLPGQLKIKTKRVQHYFPMWQKDKVQSSILLLPNNQIPAELHTSNAFFCRIEDAIAKKNKVNFKFRLGSIDYVDAMEGKGYFEAVSYSRATNFSMRYRQDR